MTTLVAQHILDISKSSDLNSVTRLKFWAKDLDILSKNICPSLQVVNFSLNKLSHISALKGCKSINQLYLRNNKLQNLDQIIAVLQQLPALQVLWIQANPCTQDKGYTSKILKALPNLQKLDGKPRAYFTNKSANSTQKCDYNSSKSSLISENDFLPEMAKS